MVPTGIEIVVRCSAGCAGAQAALPSLAISLECSNFILLVANHPFKFGQQLGCQGGSTSDPGQLLHTPTLLFCPLLGLP